MYQLTINAPEEKGWTHEHILEVMRGNFKTLVYICMADEQGSCYHTHIFVVFANSHPEIVIASITTNKDTTKMYNQVLSSTNNNWF